MDGEQTQEAPTTHDRPWVTKIVRFNSVAGIVGACGMILFSIIALAGVPESDNNARLACATSLALSPILVIITYNGFWRRNARCSSALTVLYAIIGSGATVWFLFDIVSNDLGLVSRVGTYSTEQALFSLRRLLVEVTPLLYATWSSYPQYRWTQKLRGDLATA